MISAIGWGGEASCSRSCGQSLLCVGRAERPIFRYEGSKRNRGLTKMSCR